MEIDSRKRVCANETLGRVGIGCQLQLEPGRGCAVGGEGY